MKLHRGFALVTLAASLALHASGSNACVWSSIDHKIGYDQSGVWNPSVYRSVLIGVSALQAGGALWEGAESRFGKTMWQGIDAQLIGAATVGVTKRVFTRVRPTETDDPCNWFAHGSNYSFPSEEAALSAALVTPYILEYGSEYPATYGLLLLPLYVGAARLKAQAHWQSDVLFGWAIGGLAGWYAHSRKVPILIEILPHGVMVGLKKRF